MRDLVASAAALLVVGASSVAAASHLVEANPPTPPTVDEVDQAGRRVHAANARLLALVPAVLPASAGAWDLVLEGQRARLAAAQARYVRWSALVDEASSAGVDGMRPRAAYRDAAGLVLEVHERYLVGIADCLAGPVEAEVATCATSVTALAAGAFAEVLPPLERARAAVAPAGAPEVWPGPAPSLRG